MLRRVIYFAGVGIAFISVAYVLYVLFANEIWKIAPAILQSLVWLVLLGSLFYALASIFLSAAWWRLLAWIGEPVPNAWLCHGIYGRAQLAKYIPGNIFSLVGRHVLSRRAGFSHWSLVSAAILEIMGVIFSAALVTLFGIQVWGNFGPVISATMVILTVAGLVLLPLAIPKVLNRLKSLDGQPISNRTFRDYVRLVAIYLLYLPFFMASGTVLWILAGVLAPETEPAWGEIVAVASVTWIIGFITPGASGGIGVRDALLVLSLNPILGGFAAPVAVVAYRIVTVLGDVAYFGLAHLFPVPHGFLDKGSQ